MCAFTWMPLEVIDEYREKKQRMRRELPKAKRVLTFKFKLDINERAAASPQIEIYTQYCARLACASLARIHRSIREVVSVRAAHNAFRCYTLRLRIHCSLRCLYDSVFVEHEQRTHHAIARRCRWIVVVRHTAAPSKHAREKSREKSTTPYGHNFLKYWCRCPPTHSPLVSHFQKTRKKNRFDILDRRA